MAESNRDEIIRRIRDSSKDEVVYQEMVRHGFWPAMPPPEEPPDEVGRLFELRKTLDQLRSQQRMLESEKAVLRQQRLERLKASRKKRQETKQRRLQERRERHEAWDARNRREVLFLGEGVSGGLHDRDCQVGNGLPILSGGDDVARALGIGVPQLRFLAYHRRVSSVSHYVRFTIPKRTGGERVISAPMPRMKAAQEWILREILEKIPVHDASHGFRKGRSIVTNARPHVGADVLINLDVRDFFPSITYRRVRGVFRKMGYGEAVATVLSLLCTEPSDEQVEIDGRTWYVASGPRRLPQGAPTSPAITNLLCRSLDRRLAHLAAQTGFIYTRYGDDVTFSARGEGAEAVGKILSGLKSIIAHEGFPLNTDKTRILRKGRQQEVTGVVVNRKMSVSRQTLRRFRAVLFQIEKDGPAGKHWGPSKDVIASVRGFANFVAMVDPEKGRALQQRVKAVIAANRWQPARHARASSAALPLPPSPPAATLPPPPEEPPSPPGQSEERPWWKFW